MRLIEAAMFPLC